LAVERATHDRQKLSLVTFKCATTLESLLARAKEKTDLQAAQAMQKAKAALFAMFNRPGRKSQT
jgi:hypothetical protein